ncbi:hypothetical protein [Cerasicoccus frondis]|uniref:hypothetical protein n=1 Tax=Cerasicoccus frondis TaxID=490090 RepID=UPI00285262A7|nr:hypothetical protein [Cerasicoccus frondis]
MDTFTSFGVGTGVGAATQIASELFKIKMSADKQRHEFQMANSKEGRAWFKLRAADANDAAKRGSGVKLLSFTSILGYIVVGTLFLLAWYAGWLEIPTAYITEQAGDSFLWGLIEFAPSVSVENVTGFVNFPEMRNALSAFIGFICGIKGVSTGANNLTR